MTGLVSSRPVAGGRILLFGLSLFLVAPTVALAQVSTEPFFDARSRQVEYAGPGREDPAPDDPTEVLIGYFGPDDPGHPVGGDLWLASSLAVEQANRDGGYRGIPFRLVPAWSENPWGTGVARLARAVYEDEVWAVIGSIDGASTHLAEQVVAKARLTLVAPAGTDKTVNYANVAWMFSCLPADDRQAELLAGALADDVGPRSFTVVSTTDHDARAATAELRGALDRRGIGPTHHLELEPGTEDLTELADRIAASAPDAVAILAGPIDSARLVVALRARRSDLTLFGGSSMGRRVFLEQAGAAADGVRFPRLCDPATSSQELDRTFEARFGRRADCATSQAYDATRLLIAAIREAGLNRARIRDAVQGLAPWSGVAGAIEWNAVGQNRREVGLATYSDGSIAPLSKSGPFLAQ
jgi:ABC-type branched-subunit amino acid transport system substrate-binding protein